MRLYERISRLEKRAGDAGSPSVTLVVTYAEEEAAVARYKAEHPGWEKTSMYVICVESEEAKRLTERLLAGERTDNVRA